MRISDWSSDVCSSDLGETLAEAVTRELREETGLEGLCGPLLGWAERIDAEGHYVILDFEVTVVDLIEPVAGDDAAEARWVDLHEVAELHLVEALPARLADNGPVITFTSTTPLLYPYPPPQAAAASPQTIAGYNN